MRLQGPKSMVLIAANFGGGKPKVKVCHARKGKEELVFGSAGVQCSSVLPFLSATVLMTAFLMR